MIHSDVPAWVLEMNQLGKSQQAFFFAIDFEIQFPVVQALNDIDPNLLRFNFKGYGNIHQHIHYLHTDITLNPAFVSRKNYSRGFTYIQQEQRRGNSVLANLTCPTELQLGGTFLRELVNGLDAPYRLWMKPAALTGESHLPQEILVFSPETFLQTCRGKMHTFPMKGTAFVPAGADREGLRRRLLSNEKEQAEHTTVVDLLRNDLGRVGKKVEVDDFFARISSIPVPGGEILQASSRISADLPANWQEHIGSIFAELLPAGSVSGAPKRETCRIIREAEARIAGAPLPRGYYCGVAGVYDGQNIDSAVLIRFIEKRPGPGPGRHFFRSGGGITVYSQEGAEYEELMAKVRLPLRQQQQQQQ